MSLNFAPLIPMDDFPYIPHSSITATQSTREFKEAINIIVMEKIETLVTEYADDGSIEFSDFPDEQPHPNEQLNYTGFSRTLNNNYSNIDIDRESIEHLMGIADSLGLTICKQADTVGQSAEHNKRLGVASIETLQGLYSYDI